MSRQNAQNMKIPINERKKSWILCQLIYREAIQELDILFHQWGKKYMLIKGANIIDSGLSEKMSQRQINDIDILLHEEDMGQVTDLFFALDNVSETVDYKNNYLGTESSFIFKIGTQAVPVELHTHINLSQRFSLPAALLFNRAYSKDGVKYIPCCEDVLLMCICHILCHIPYEFRHYNLEEMHLLIHQDGFNWQQFWKYAAESGIEPFIFFMLHHYEKQYGIAIHAPRYYWYAKILAEHFSIRMYEKTQPLLRRILFEIPFLKNPAGLVFHKLRRLSKRRAVV